MLEVLSLDLYFNVQVGVAFSQVAGDYNLELAESQVSLVFHLYKHTELAGCVRNGRLTLLEKLPLCASWVLLNVAIIWKKYIISLVFNCHSCAAEFCVDLFLSGGFPNTKETQ